MMRMGSARWWAFGAVSLGVLAVSLDGTVLSVALPTLAKSLHASESDLEWFSAGYLLVLAAATLPAGLFGDRFGRKRVLLASLGVFGAGSAWCAYSPSPGPFLVARLVMGAAGAGVAVMASASSSTSFWSGLKRLLSRYQLRLRSCSSLRPAALPAAELMSIQNGHSTSLAARIWANTLSWCGTSFVLSSAWPNRA